MLLVFAFSIVMSVVISVVATLYPAYRAAKSNPVEALRFEI
jgi:ABC-type lipoprotein release transport system permease subunit